MKQRLYIVKIGGNIIDDEAKLSQTLSAFASIEGRKILVHGGGKIASEMSIKMGLAPSIVDGRRITDEETLKIICMVYAGWINKRIVALLQSYGCDATGLSGADSNILPAKKREAREIDYGYVGDPHPSEVNIRHLSLLLENGLIPVIAPITHDQKGQLLNTNADTIAATLAASLSDHFDVQLLFCFEKNGILMNVADESSLISSISTRDYKELKAGKVVSDGMIPKLDNAFAAINSGVQTVWIGHADRLLKMVNQEENAATRLIY